jgi:hypothetical protein
MKTESMRRTITLTVFAILFGFMPCLCQNPRHTKPAEKPEESEHIQGPNGLKGWTENWPIEGSGYGDQKLPTTLVVARNGHILRRIEGDGFVWNWIFWADGRQVAYESGPLHFGLACALYDLKKGRELSRVDCYHDLPQNAPAWVRALESATRK